MLKDLITENLELADDTQIDRVRCLNAKPSSPAVTRCTFFFFFFFDNGIILLEECLTDCTLTLDNV